MPLQPLTRPLNDLEKRYLHRVANDIQTEINKKPPYINLLLCMACGIVFTYMATNTQNGPLLFVTGTVAVICFSAVVFGPYEYYKSHKHINNQHKQITTLLEQNTITTTAITATRVAVAKEYDDEGTMFILECGPGSVVIFEDYTFLYGKRLPCLNFEVYSNDYYELTGIQIYAIDKKCDAIKIDAGAKERYFKKHGYPGQMEIINRGFDDMVNEIRLG